jgi:hypothetical protein
MPWVVSLSEISYSSVSWRVWTYLASMVVRRWCNCSSGSDTLDLHDVSLSVSDLWKNLRDPAGLLGSLGFLGWVSEFVFCIEGKRSEGGGRTVYLLWESGCGSSSR